MKGANQRLILEEEGIGPGGKSHQGLLPIRALVQLGSSILLILFDEILNKLIENVIGIS
jgi:hypothetical protein